MRKIHIKQMGITDMPCDAIVNAANSALFEGGGVCGVIFRSAGSQELTKACSAIGHCEEGSAVITPGFNSPGKYIIHAVGPVYMGGQCGEDKKLYGAYKTSLELCLEHNLHSVVFPLISAGIFGYPVREAWKQAICACRDFMDINPCYDIEITFAIPEDSKYQEGIAILKREMPENGI